MPHDTAPRRTPGVQRYDLVTRVLHWSVAAAVAAQWLGAHAIDHFPPGAERVAVRSAHILIGAALTAVLATRIWWRARHGARFAPDRRKALAAIARLTHLSLYALLIAVLGLGLLNTWVRGDSIFGWFHIPAFGDYPAAVRHGVANRLVAWHRLAANLILAVVAVHAGAALAHHFWLKDTVLRRMALIPDWRRR